nr:nuclease A inhibitor family protein [Nostoc sp. LEGE 06077]
MTKTNSEILEQLKLAIDGLLFMSESDYPFSVFLWEITRPATPEKISQQTNHPIDTPVKIVGFDDFFQVATTEEYWHGEEEKKLLNDFNLLCRRSKKN